MSLLCGFVDEGKDTRDTHRRGDPSDVRDGHAHLGEALSTEVCIDNPGTARQFDVSFGVCRQAKVGTVTMRRKDETD